jgi:hypothetical protein
MVLWGAEHPTTPDCINRTALHNQHRLCFISYDIMKPNVILIATSLLYIAAMNQGIQAADCLPGQAPLLYAHEKNDHTHPDNESRSDQHEPETSMPAMQGEGEHEHRAIAIPANQPVPTLHLIVHPDARQGWNLELQVANFSFAPEHVNQESSTTEGHAHLYIDGVKITRLYGTWYYLADLTPGTHEITVSLNTNGHEALMYDGQPIADTVIVDVP